MGNLSLFARGKLVLATTAAVLLSTVAARAATREVGPGQTYATIQACLNAAVAGDVCNVRAGVYTEQLSLPSSGTLANRITLRANGSDVVTVQSASSPVLNINGKSYWTFVGVGFSYLGSGSAPRVVSHATGAGNVNYLTFTNCTMTLSSGTGAGFGMYIANSDRLTVTGSTINITATTGSHDGADLLFASNLQFAGNRIGGNASETTGRLEDGIVVSGTNLNMEDNVLHDGWSYDSHPDGIVVQGDGDRNGNNTANVTVVRNTIYNFTQGVYFDAIWNPLGGSNLIANNVIYETSGFRYGGAANKMNGIVIDGESLSGPNYAIQAGVYNNTIDARQLHIYNLRQAAGSTVVIKNNVLVSPTFTAMYLTTTTGVTLDYNYYSGGNATPIKWGTTNYSLASFRSATGQEANSRSGAANLNVDYTENLSSDTRGRGLNLYGLFTTDRAGQARPSGVTPWDAGAYQLAQKPQQPTNLRVVP